MWIIAALFFTNIFQDKLDFNFSGIKFKWQKCISLILIFWGLLIYPMIEIMLGFIWPNMVFFGAECPTTIFVIGLLIGSLPRVNKTIYIFLSIGAIISGGMWGFQGAWFDIAYFSSGVIALIILIIYRKKIEMEK
ncbi:MAG: DUF6064 family protein [Promethearchaeota archaeon]